MTSSINFELKYPPESQLCEKHRLATRIWRGITDQSKKQICECCNRKVGFETVETKCMQNSSNYSFLGPGIPLFFKFSKYSVFVLILITLLFSIFALYSNIVSKNCEHNQNCVPTVFNSMSLNNKKKEFQYLKIQNYLLLSFVIVCFFLLHFYRYRFRKCQQKIDKLNVSAGDYAIMLKRLPGYYGVQDIHKMLEQTLQNHSPHQNQSQKIVKQFPKIENIILSYDPSKYFQQKQQFLNDYKDHLTTDNKEQHFGDDIGFQKKDLGRIAFVVFQDQQTKKYFIHEPSFFQRVLHYFCTPFTPLSHLEIKNEKISIERAPQPDDVLWQNVHITPKERMIRKIILNFVSFTLLMIGGVCQYGLAAWQSSIHDIDLKVYIGTVASIVVTITNFVLQYFLIHSARWERMNTETQYLDVLTFKLIIQQFLNSGVFVVAANILANLNENFLESSLAETLTQIMILNAITLNISTFLTKKFDVIGIIKRFVFIRTGFFVTTQLEANKLYELPKPDFTQKYSYIVKTLWLTAFFAPFVPVVVPISTVGLIVNYFLEKFLFSSCYSVSNKISSTLNNSCIEGLQFIPLILSVSQFLIYIYLQTFYDQIPSNWLIPIYIGLALSFLNLVLPMKQFNESISNSIKNLFNFEDPLEQKTMNCKIPYSKATQMFEITYEMTNPAYDQKRGKRKDTLIERGVKNIAKTMFKQKNIKNLCILPLGKQSSSITVETQLVRQKDLAENSETLLKVQNNQNNYKSSSSTIHRKKVKKYPQETMINQEDNNEQQINNQNNRDNKRYVAPFGLQIQYEPQLDKLELNSKIVENLIPERDNQIITESEFNCSQKQKSSIILVREKETHIKDSIKQSQ